FGLDAFKRAIARGVALAELAEQTLREHEGWEIVSPATLGIVCFRRSGADDAATDELVRRTVAEGYAAPSTTILDGRTVARLCTINPRTTDEDVINTISRMGR